jgi:hypothetical protein
LAQRATPDGGDLGLQHTLLDRGAVSPDSVEQNPEKVLRGD